MFVHINEILGRGEWESWEEDVKICAFMFGVSCEMRF